MTSLHGSLLVGVCALGLAGCYAESFAEEVQREDGAQQAVVVPAPQPVEIHTILPPEKWVENPAPLPPEHPRSVSLGFIGDQPLTQSDVVPRWPWRQERFHYFRERSYSYYYAPPY